MSSGSGTDFLSSNRGCLGIHHRFIDIPVAATLAFKTVHFMGLFDTDDHLLAVATHNTDIADGWEREGESEEFFKRFSIQSYAVTINILFYALTH